MDNEEFEDLALSLLVPKYYRWMFSEEYDKRVIPRSEFQNFLNYKENLDSSKTPSELRDLIKDYKQVYGKEFQELSELSDSDLGLLIKRIEMERILAKAQRERKFKSVSSRKI